MGTVFSKKDVPDDMPEKVIGQEVKLVDWAVNENVVASKKEMIRLIQQSAVSFDGEKVIDLHVVLDVKSSAVLKIGKRRFFKLVKQL